MFNPFKKLSQMRLGTKKGWKDFNEEDTQKEWKAASLANELMNKWNLIKEIEVEQKVLGAFNKDIEKIEKAIGEQEEEIKRLDEEGQKETGKNIYEERKAMKANLEKLEKRLESNNPKQPGLEEKADMVMAKMEGLRWKLERVEFGIQVLKEKF